MLIPRAHELARGSEEKRRKREQGEEYELGEKQTPRDV
jgi:hypothetical protein